MQTTSRYLMLVLLSGCGGAYASARPTPPPQLTQNHEQQTLAKLVGFPHPATNLVMLLVNEYIASGHNRSGYEYFTERARAADNDDRDTALFTALSGMFAARMAPEVPLLSRKAWVEGAIEKLDRSVAATATHPGLERYLRGAVFAELPARFGRADTAIADLEWMLANQDHFPPGLRRGAYAGLAKAYEARGRHADAEKARAHESEPGIVSDFAVSAEDGFRFGLPGIVEPAPGIWVVRGYDFADLAFVATDDGLVAIDGGTTRESTRAALQALRARTALPIRHVIITHAHWDHVGGLGELVGPEVDVIAQSHFSQELETMRGSAQPREFFFGQHAHDPYAFSPTRVVKQRETLTVGKKSFELVPVHGGETEDALLVNLPDQHIVFVGDVFMPYFGAPFVAEGSPEGLLDAIERIVALHPKLLIHGHAPLTENFQLPALEPLATALKEVRAATLDAIANGKPLHAALGSDLVPESLRNHPDAATAFFLMRDNMIKRLYAQRTGYWKSDGEGMEVFSPSEMGRAVDLVGGGSAGAFVRAGDALIARGDHAMALRIAELGLAAHPDDRELEKVRARALDGLRAKYQFGNPFKFAIYSQMAGRPLEAAPR